MLMRAVSFFGPRFTAGAATSPRTGGTGRLAAPPFSTPGGLGSGCSMGELPLGVITGGRRGSTTDGSGFALAEGNGVIFGGVRRIGVTGVREGRTIRAVSRFTSFAEGAVDSGRGGSAMRTVSFFGSAMSELRAQRKSHKRAAAVTRFCSRIGNSSGKLRQQVVAAAASDPAGDKFPHGCGFGENDAGVNVGRIGFGPGD